MIFLNFKIVGLMVIQELASDKEDGDDDFEVVPQDQENDVDMWDAVGENEDGVKQAKIKSTSLIIFSRTLELINIIRVR